MKNLEKSEIRENGAGFMPVPPGIAGNSPAVGMYYMQNKRSFTGNCVVWWKEGGGYTSKLELAQKWTKEEAFAQAQSRDTDVPWPCDAIDPIARHTVDMQYMPGTGRVQETGSIKEFNTVCAQKQTVFKNTESSIDALIGLHGALLEDNAHCYFELAYTRRTGWMAFICDKPAGGTVGTAEFGAGRKIIAQGQGATADAACADALGTPI